MYDSLNDNYTALFSFFSVLSCITESACWFRACFPFVRFIYRSTTDQSLTEYFTAWGEVQDAIVMRDRETSRSRGFGFVTFTTIDAANAAIAHLDHELDGRRIKVNLARGGGGGGGGGGYGGGGYGGGGGGGYGGGGGGGGYGGQCDYGVFVIFTNY